MKDTPFTPSTIRVLTVDVGLLDSSGFSVALNYNWKGYRTACSSADGMASSYELDGCGFELYSLRQYIY